MRKLVLAVGLVLMASGAQAATLDVIGGQLMGASGVLVDGNLYDVQFVDGRCIDLYNGCDDTSDFTFQTYAAATLASQALLDQVFIDGPSGLFDSDPTLINGCDNVSSCMVWTPAKAYMDDYYNDGFLLPLLISWAAWNRQGSPNQLRQRVDVFWASELAPWAVWSPVPEPSTALLLGLGLTGLAAKGRRRSRS